MENKFVVKKVAVVVSFLALFLCGIAQEPSANPTNMQFSSVKAYDFTLQFTPSQADGFLVIRGNAPVQFVPTDGIVYQKGQGVGNSKVVSAGAFTSVYVREVLESSKYYFAVFAYNGSGSSVNYRQVNPLVDSVTSAGFNQDAYFSAIDSSSGTFINDLHNLINPHTMVSYSPGYRTTILPVIYERDTTGGGAVVNCEYSNTTTVYLPPFDFTAQAYNREHALPKSWMLTGGNTNNPDGADFHNLLLTRDVPNQKRSNYPLGIVVNSTWTFGLSKYGTDSNGNTVFEPQDDRKGDATRNMFYQMICYNGNGGTWGLDYLLTLATNQDQNVLKLWNAQDPPDKFERTKDEYIYSIQNNRNPFVAFPGWVDCINWDSLIKTNLCGAISGIDGFDIPEGMNVYPNPATEQVTVTWAALKGTGYQLQLTDMAGRIVLQTSGEVQSNENEVTLNVGSLTEGIYILHLNYKGKRAYQRIVVSGR